MNPLLLMLECDADDRYITELLFKESKLDADLLFKHNSTDFFAYLEACKQNTAGYPAMILLDMNTVPLDALEVLKRIKSATDYNFIPVIILSETASARVVRECYSLGASSFIIKPDSNDQADKKIIHFLRYWLETVELP